MTLLCERCAATLEHTAVECLSIEDALRRAEVAEAHVVKTVEAAAKALALACERADAAESRLAEQSTLAKDSHAGWTQVLAYLADERKRLAEVTADAVQLRGYLKLALESLDIDDLDEEDEEWIDGAHAALEAKP